MKGRPNFRNRTVWTGGSLAVATARRPPARGSIGTEGRSRGFSRQVAAAGISASHHPCTHARRRS